MSALEQARLSMAEGQLTDASRAAQRWVRESEGASQLDGLLVLIEVQLLLNTRLEVARSLALARGQAKKLGLVDLEHRVRLFAVETALMGDVQPSAEILHLSTLPLTEEHRAWLSALQAASLVRGGDAGGAGTALQEARRGILLGASAAIRILPWIVRTELDLEAPERALHAARTGQVLADSLGWKAHVTLFERLAAQGEAASSPEAQQAVLRLVDLASATAGLRDVDVLLKQVCRSMMQLLDVDRAFVVLRGPTGSLRVRAGVGRQGEPAGAPSRSIVQRTLRTGHEVVSNDLDQDGSSRSASIVSMGVRSVICAPLLHGTEALGVVYGDSERVTEHELKQLVWLARGIAGVGAVAIWNAQQLDAAEVSSERGREVAHDVRNLVNLVRLSAEDIGEAEDVPAWARQLAGQAAMASKRMVAQLEQVLTPKPMKREPLDLMPFLADLMGMLGREARECGVELELSGQRIAVSATTDELGRAFTNLLTNAVKYAPRGSVVEVVVRGIGGRAQISIRDRGPGIPPDELDRIFESGHQARGAKTGFGLGLSIASKVVAAHSGEIHVENHPEGGAMFTVRLPLL